MLYRKLKNFMNKINTILIIGSEGFLGQKLVTYFYNLGYEIIGIDIQKNAQNDSYYKHFIQKNISFIDKDDLSIFTTQTNCNYGLINTGGVSRNGMAAKYPIESCNNTISSYVNLLEQLNSFPPKWMILTSTREVEILLTNNDNLNGKQKLYSIYKLTTELVSSAYQEEWDIPLRICRLSDIFGVGDHSSKVMQIFIKKAISNDDINVNTPNSKLFLTEVNEISQQLYDVSIQLEMEISNPKTVTLNLWDETYFITLLELAHLILELNPQSTSKIITTTTAEINYSVKNKIKPYHLKVLNNF